jgi:hypothetical protein
VYDFSSVTKDSLKKMKMPMMILDWASQLQHKPMKMLKKCSTFIMPIEHDVQTE